MKHNRDVLPEKKTLYNCYQSTVTATSAHLYIANGKSMGK
jgi:hypothetical protein